MTVGSSWIKEKARSILSGNMLKSVLSPLIFLFSAFIGIYLSSVASLFSGEIFSQIFFVLFSFFLLAPLFFGVLRFFWRLIKNSDDKPISVFYYFSSYSLYIKVLKFLITVISKLIPIALILFLPVFLIWVLSQNFLFDFFDIAIPIWSRNLSYAILFFKTISNAILIFFSLKFYLAPVLFIANEQIDVQEAVHMSTVISKKTSLDFIFLMFSFFGWIILSFIAVFILFVLPYVLTSYVIHSDLVITEYNEHIKILNEKNYPTFSVGGYNE